MLKRWSVAPFWRPEEGVALGFGYDPDAVIIREAHADPQLWVDEDGKHFLELARRAVQAGELDREASPAEFVAWGARVHLTFHQDWHDAIKRDAIEIERDGEFNVLAERAHEAQLAAIRLQGLRRMLARKWANAPTWTLREALALSFDFDPIETDGEEPGISGRSPAEFERRIKFAQRAVKQGELKREPTPSAFVTWAAGMGFPFDSIWLDYLPEAAAVLRPEPEVDIPAFVPDEPKPLATRERESMLKLIIGMAVEQYRYDPRASRNEATSRIAEDLAGLGMPMEADTVRKYLKQGADLLPSDALDDDC